MKMIIDIGNTCAKVGIFEGKELIDMRYYASLTEAEIRSIRKEFVINEAILCTVSKTPNRIEEEFKDIKFLLWNTYKQDLDLPISILWKEEKKQTLGRDRVAVGMALRKLYPNETVLGIVMGSCTTYNIVQADGSFVPGAISPGVSMRSRAMHDYTYALPLVDLCLKRENKRNLGLPIEIKDTESSLLSGVIEGINYEIIGFISRYREKYGNIPVILTGGDAIYFDISIKKKIFASPNLVLIGLNEILDIYK